MPKYVFNPFTAKLDVQASTKSDVGLSNVDNVQQMPLSYLDTDGTLSANSDTKVASQKAVKTYTDQLISSANALVYKGTIDCSANPNYPSADAGHLYIVSVAGKIGGASGVNVEVGDMIICNTDATPSGNQATVGANFNIIEKNIEGAVSGPASAVANNVAFFDGVTGKLIKDSGLTLSGTNTGDITITDSSTIDFTLTNQALSGSVIQSGITHNNLGGLTTGDPHTQYALLAGRSGGQSLSGGTAANDDLTLQGTTNATRTTSYVIMQPNGGNVGIGTTSPGALLEISKSTSSTSFGNYPTMTITNANTIDDSFATINLRSGTVAGFGVAGLVGQLIGYSYDNTGQLVWLRSTAATSPIHLTTGSTKTHGITILNGDVGINDTAPSAQLHVDQTSTTAAKPTLRLQQADLSEEFIRFDTTVGTGNPINTTAEGTYYGRVRVWVEGVGAKWISLHNA